MNIYNKKGFVSGIFCSGLGGFCLIRYVMLPSDILALQMKHLVFAGLMILIGINYIIRAFSNKDTEEDIAEKLDTRNCTIKAKSNAMSFIILQRLLIIGVILSFVLFCLIENLLIITILITMGLLLSISLIIEFITMIKCTNTNRE